MIQAWKRAGEDSRFRLARLSDFEKPSMIYDYGEIAGAYGLAILLVDKTVEGPERFSLVIFIERPANKYDVYWIYRNMNLSNSSMSRASGDIFVETVLEDGRVDICEIHWDKKQRRWACAGLGAS
jgi:hypothetical protein